MATVTAKDAPTEGAQRGMNALKRATFVAAICTGSFLLFLIQPMVARMALPRLGGAPAVWNSAMLVYQALLLAGYAYAHALGQLSPRRQGMAHGALLLLAALSLPISLAGAVPPPGSNPFLWVPALLAMTVGPIFFVVAAQAPLMQRWYLLAGGHDPYPLYAASNLGSFGGLIAYPLLVEPALSVAEQSKLWAAGYALLLMLVLLCARALPKSAIADGMTRQQSEAAPPPTMRTLALCVLLAAVPSGLMLSTTLHLTTDIVAMPLLWVLPLGLYLLSFSVAFASGRKLADGIVFVTPIFLLMSACAAFVEASQWAFVLAGAALVSLFVISVALHAEMYAHRPHPSHLTKFYLAMSIGGALGGIFCALVAPLIFNWTFEHPLLIIAAATLVWREPMFDWSQWRFARSGPARGIATVAVVAIALLLSLVGSEALDLDVPGGVLMTCILALILLSVASIGHRWLFVGVLSALMLCLGGWDKLSQATTEGAMIRSYFGNYTIGTDGKERRVLVHGTTVHGVQNLNPRIAKEPTTYYVRPSGIGLAMQAAPALFGNQARIDVVGLGAGTLACYAKPGQHWRFYEIDPVIVDIARNPKDFTFLSRCLPSVPVALGDARLVLAQQADAKTDMLVVDAFSSDSVPMHLLTREALDTYGRHMQPHGLLMIHISNRYLDLKPVLASAQRHGWTVRTRLYLPAPAARKKSHAGSVWVALSRDPETIEKLADASPAGNWKPMEERAGFRPWTDDYASILPILKIWD